MELLLLQVSAFLRPIFFIDVKGSQLFDAAAIGIFAALVVALLSNAALRQNIRLSAVDFVIAAFGVWCVSIYFIYWDKSQVRAVAQFLIPLFTYTATKNVLTSDGEYRRLMLIIALGFLVPILVSAVLILNGGGIDFVNYRTGLPRWRGAYNGSHTFAHNMTFVIFVVFVYLSVTRSNVDDQVRKVPLWIAFLFGSLVILAVVGLALSRVRTAIMGLVVALLLYGWFVNRKLLLAGGAVAAILLVVLGPTFLPILFHDVYSVLEGRRESTELGSGRMGFWVATLETFAEAPLDQKIAGIGIGNRDVDFGGVDDPHNDWLHLLMQTGFVGVGLYGLVQLLVLRAILKLDGRERFAFIAVFFAVQVMNVLSNSYVSRFGLAQMYYMMIAFVELRSAHGRSGRVGEISREQP